MQLNYKELIIILFCLVIPLGCKKQKSNNENKKVKYNVIVEESTFKQPLNKIADLLEIIPLQTNKKCLIGEVKQLLKIDSNYVVVSKGMHDKVFVFGNEGSFKCEVGHIGKGVGEFLEAFDVGYNEFKNLLYVYDKRRKTVNYYTTEGLFINATKCKLLFKKLVFLDNNNVALFNSFGRNSKLKDNERAQLIIAKNNFEPISFHFPKTTPRSFHHISNSSLTTNNSKVFFNPLHSDSIFRVYKDSIVGYSAFDLKINPIPYPRIHSEITDTEFKLKKNKYNFFDGFFAQFDKYDLYKYWISAKYSKYVFYNKNDNKSIEIIPDPKPYISNLLFFNPIPISNNEFACIISASKICQIRDNIDWSNYDIPLNIKQIFDLVKPEDNPVIALYRIK